MSVALVCVGPYPHPDMLQREYKGPFQLERLAECQGQWIETSWTEAHV